MINIVFVAGVRAHFIKLGAIKDGLSRLSKDIKDQLNIILINSGQHYSDELSKIYINKFDLKFDYTLNYDSYEKTHIQGLMFEKITHCYEDIIKKYGKIDFLVVMGDVATTFIAAFAGISMDTPLRIAHIEGGLKTIKNRPEEYYRNLTDEVSELIFSSEKLDNADYEGCYFSGDIMYDYLSHNDFYKKTNKVQMIGSDNQIIDFSLEEKYILASIHHKENTKNASTLMDVFDVLAKRKEKIVFITHPSIKKMIDENGIKVPDNFILVKSLEYHTCMSLVYHSLFTLTDSGGIQRESYYLNKHCIVINDDAYWKCLLLNGNNRCVKEKNEINSALIWAIENKDKIIPYNGEFGKGNAVELIFAKIIERV